MQCRHRPGLRMMRASMHRKPVSTAQEWEAALRSGTLKQEAMAIKAARKAALAAATRAAAAGAPQSLRAAGPDTGLKVCKVVHALWDAHPHTFPACLTAAFEVHTYAAHLQCMGHVLHTSTVLPTCSRYCTCNWEHDLEQMSAF